MQDFIGQNFSFVSRAVKVYNLLSFFSKMWLWWILLQFLASKRARKSVQKRNDVNSFYLLFHDCMAVTSYKIICYMFDFRIIFRTFVPWLQFGVELCFVVEKKMDYHAKQNEICTFCSAFNFTNWTEQKYFEKIVNIKKKQWKLNGCKPYIHVMNKGHFNWEKCKSKFSRAYFHCFINVNG